MSIALSWALSRGDCRVVENIVHVNEGVRHVRAMGPGSWESRTRVGSIEVDYQTELQQLVTRVFIQVRGVIRIRLI